MLDAAEHEGFQAIASWEGNGDGFMIRNPKKFETVIIPRFFNKPIKMKVRKERLRRLYG